MEEKEKLEFAIVIFIKDYRVGHSTTVHGFDSYELAARAVELMRAQSYGNFSGCIVQTKGLIKIT